GSDVAQGASRQDARSGRSQIEILAVCLLNESVEFGVVEDGPPAGQIGDGGVDSPGRAVDPLACHGRRGLLIVRPHFEAISYVLANARAAAAEQDDEPECYDKPTRPGSVGGDAWQLGNRVK